MTKHITHVNVIMKFFSDYTCVKNDNFQINGHHLTIAHIAKFANIPESSNCERNEVGKNVFFHPKVEIVHGAKNNISENAQFLDTCLKSGRIIYGVNTGYGGSANVRNYDTCENQRVLVFLLNSGLLKKTMNPGVVKASMLVRANSLSHARSGVRLEIIQLLCDMVNSNIIPMVPLRGSISASGDLMPLSYVASCMSGLKADSLVYFNGRTDLTAAEAFKLSGLNFVRFKAKEALAVVNASSCAASLAAINLFEFSQLILLAELITAMSVECLHGRMESFHSSVYECLHHYGMKEFSESINFLLRSSKFTKQVVKINEESDKIDNHGLAQDRYALRASPQWFSPIIETFNESVRRVNIELNSTNDNPIIDHVNNIVIHCGNFLGSHTTVAMDQTRQSVQMCAKLIFAQLSEILNCHFSEGLTPNLSGFDYTRDYGFKGVDIALASYTSEIQHLNSPLTNHVLSAEMHNQSINSLALISSRATSETLEILKLMIASSLLCLCQALDLRWLQFKISEAWTYILKEVNLPNSNIEDQRWPWYDLAFRFHYIEKRLKTEDSLWLSIADGVTVDAACKNRILDYLKHESRRLVTELYKNEQIDEITSFLGLGTKEMYKFIRHNLDIKFHSNSETLDVALKKVFDSIDRKETLQVLETIFSNTTLQ